MVECPICNISFSPKHSVCPRCQRYQAKLEDRIQYLADRAEVALENGARDEDVRRMLIDEGVSPSEAHEIAVGKRKKVRGIVRGYASLRILGGLAGIPLTLVAATLLLIRPSIYIIIAVCTLGSASVSLLVSGIYSIVTGRESR